MIWLVRYTGLDFDGQADSPLATPQGLPRLVMPYCSVMADGSSNNGLTPISELHGHTGGVKCVAWSPDGLRLASGSADATVRVWDPASGEVVDLHNQKFKLAGSYLPFDPIYSVAWSPDSSRLAYSWGNKITGPGVPRWLEGHTGKVISVAWSPDGRWLASGALRDEKVRVWDASSGKCVKVLGAMHDPLVVWSPDGGRLAYGSRHDGYVKVVEVGWAVQGRVPSGIRRAMTGVEARGFRSGGPRIESIAWSPDGSRLAFNAGYLVRVWDLAAWESAQVMEVGTGGAWSVAWSPDGSRLASGSADGTLRVWDSATGGCLSSVEAHAHIVNSVAWSPDGSRLASGGQDAGRYTVGIDGPNQVRIWAVNC